MTTAYEQTELRIAAALSARARGITMDTSTLEHRLAEVQERGARDRRRRRGTAVGAAVLATAAAVLAALTLGGGLLRDDEPAPPADRERAVIVQPSLVGSGRPEAERTLSVERFAVPFTFALPDQGDTPGTWYYDVGDGRTFYVGLDASARTGHANVVLTTPGEVHDPERPGAATVDAPVDGDGWQRWLESTGEVAVTDREDLTVGGAPATRLTLALDGDVPTELGPCPPRETNRCLTLGPDLPSLGAASELTVIDLGTRTVVAVAVGAPETTDEWLPLLRSVVDSLRFA